jgi:hypothetical protein
MSHTILVKITINFKAGDKNHNVRGFFSLLSILSKLLYSWKTILDSIEKYQYSAIITVKKVIMIMINMAMKLINFTEPMIETI